MHAAVPSLFRPLPLPGLLSVVSYPVGVHNSGASFVCPSFPSCDLLLDRTICLIQMIFVDESNRILSWLIYLSICNNPVLSHLILSLTFLSYPSACSSYCPHVQSWSLLVGVFTTFHYPGPNQNAATNQYLGLWSHSPQCLPLFLIPKPWAPAHLLSCHPEIPTPIPRPKTAQNGRFNHSTGPTITWWFHLAAQHLCSVGPGLYLKCASPTRSLGWQNWNDVTQNWMKLCQEDK